MPQPSEVKWAETTDGGAICSLGGETLRVSGSRQDCGRLRLVIGPLVIQPIDAPDLDAAKAEALRLVREAVKRLADAVGEGT